MATMTDDDTINLADAPDLVDSILLARDVIAKTLAARMQSAAMAAVNRFDFQKLAGESLEGIDLSDMEAILEAADEALAGVDWGFKTKAK